MRKIKFSTGNIYHVFNRGVEKREIFLENRDNERFLKLIEHYKDINIKLSVELRNSALERLTKHGSENGVTDSKVEILVYNLMPNHFHLCLRQLRDNGITDFMHRTATGYVNYFNLKYDREGSLFQGPFKAVLVESDEQLIHLSKYIHTNHLSLAKSENKQQFLLNYKWSSLPEYLFKSAPNICNKDEIMSYFGDIEDYKDFILSEVNENYMRNLGGIDIDDDFHFFEQMP